MKRIYIYIIGSCFCSLNSLCQTRLLHIVWFHKIFLWLILIQLFLKILFFCFEIPHDVDLSICLCLYFSNEHKNKSFCYEGWHFHLESVSIDLKNQYYRVLKCIKFLMMISAAGDIWFVLICRKCCIDDFFKRM